MIGLLARFAAACRSAGLRVSTAEIIDCARQLSFIDVLDEDRFKTVLRANFAKSRRDQRAFDRIYRLFFHEMQPPGNRPDPHGADFGAESRLLADLRADSAGDDLDRALFDFLAGDPAAYLGVLRDLENRQEGPAAGAIRSNLGHMAGRMQVMLRINALRTRAARLPQQAPSDRADSQRHAAAGRIRRRLDRALQMLTEDTRPYNDGLRQVRTHARHIEDLGERPFSSLSAGEIEQMREVIGKLVRKLKDRMGRRYAAAASGMPDVQRTLRYSGRFQGVPMVIRYRRRPARKTRIVALCDVSGSVWSAARFMLNLLYSLQDCFAAVHSFAFVCATTDITEIFEQHEINRALEKVLSSPDIDFDAMTDYGEVFLQFRRDYMHLVNRKTTVIIVGDARSNYQHPRESVLEEIRQKSRRIVWLNPEPEAFWASGDSEMNTYKAYCHEVRACWNLNQLVDFIEELV